MAEIQTQYYEDKYLNGGKYEDGTAIGTYAEYAKSKLESDEGVKTSSGANLTFDGTKVSYTKDGKEVATGTFDETTGVVEIAVATAGESDPTPTYTAYTRGQTITIENKDGIEQSFYVLHDSSESEEKVTLLAAKNINTSTLLQANDANTIAFSANNGWAEGDNLNEYNEGSLKTDGTSAVYYAVQYGEKFNGGTGRLMIYEEANKLKDSYSSMIYGTNSTAGYLNYWLGFANGTVYVWTVFGCYKSLGTTQYYNDGYSYSVVFGVRPVIEISKSLIQE